MDCPTVPHGYVSYTLHLHLHRDLVYRDEGQQQKWRHIVLGAQSSKSVAHDNLEKLYCSKLPATIRKQAWHLESAKQIIFGKDCKQLHTHTQTALVVCTIGITSYRALAVGATAITWLTIVFKIHAGGGGEMSTHHDVLQLSNISLIQTYCSVWQERSGVVRTHCTVSSLSQFILGFSIHWSIVEWNCLQ